MLITVLNELDKDLFNPQNNDLNPIITLFITPFYRARTEAQKGRVICPFIDLVHGRARVLNQSVFLKN